MIPDEGDASLTDLCGTTKCLTNTVCWDEDGTGWKDEREEVGNGVWKQPQTCHSRFLDFSSNSKPSCDVVFPGKPSHRDLEGSMFRMTHGFLIHNLIY